MPSDLWSAVANAKVLTHENAPGLMGCVEELAGKAKTFTPKTLLLPMSGVNAAFHPASGRLFVTEGILRFFDSKDLHKAPSKEMRAVLAHEMGHVRFRWSQMGTMLLALGGIPLMGMGAMYIVGRTNETLKENNKLHPDHPEAFWDGLRETTSEMYKNGAWKTYRDFANYWSPTMAKITGKDEKYKDVSWGNTILNEGKSLAYQAALMVPALAACRPIAIANEYQCDRFAVALTGNKEDFLSAMKKLARSQERAVMTSATTPLEKSWGKYITDGFKKIMENTLMAHPELSKRIDIIEKINVSQVARSFHL